MKDYKKYLSRANKVPMIEILADNDLVKEINSTGKKISIRHYLNTYLFPVGEDEKDEPIYSLYYRVIFNKQSVKIKSNISRAYKESMFTLELLTDEDILLMKREALALTQIVSSVYRSVLEQASLDSEKSIKEVEDEFDINQIFGSFKFSYYELPNIVERRLLEIIKNRVEKLGESQDILDLFNHSDSLNAYQVLQYLKSKNSEWEEFEKQYHSQVWFFNIHYYNFLNSSKEYHSLGATLIDLKFKDLKDKNSGLKKYKNPYERFKESDFEKSFKEIYTDSEFVSLFDNVKYLLNL